MQDKYRYRIESNYRCGRWINDYILQTEYGAINFWVYTDDKTCGLEFHYLKRPSSMEEGTAPSHYDCPYVHANCWHDGSSLWAMENILPYYGDNEAIFNILETMVERLKDESNN
jgi:hypothetical protein